MAKKKDTSVKNVKSEQRVFTKEDLKDYAAELKRTLKQFVKDIKFSVRSNFNKGEVLVAWEDSNADVKEIKRVVKEEWPCVDKSITIKFSNSIAKATTSTRKRKTEINGVEVRDKEAWKIYTGEDLFYVKEGKVVGKYTKQFEDKVRISSQFTGPANVKGTYYKVEQVKFANGNIYVIIGDEIKKD